jgi:hypothetical protein
LTLEIYEHLYNWIRREGGKHANVFTVLLWADKKWIIKYGQGVGLL